MSSVSGHLLQTAAPRKWGNFFRGAFGPLALLADVIAIVATAGLSGAIYHWLAYVWFAGNSSFFEVGAVAASIFVLPNICMASTTPDARDDILFNMRCKC